MSLSELYRPDRDAIAITGIGMVTPLGLDPDANWQAHARGECAISRLDAFPSDTFPLRYAGQVRGFKPSGLVPDRKALKLMDRQTRLAVVACGQAIERAGENALPASDRRGLFVTAGYESAALPEVLPMFAHGRSAEGGHSIDRQRLLTEGRDAVSPLAALKTLPNMPLAHCAIAWDLHGANRALSPSATQALRGLDLAALAIAEGDAEVALVGGTWAPLNPFVVGHLGRLGLLAQGRAHTPFSPQADGTVLGEGAVFLFLETVGRALDRGAEPIGLLAGQGFAMGYQPEHGTLREAGTWKQASERALGAAGWRHDQVSEVWPDARAVRALDKVERAGLLACSLSTAVARVASPGSGYLGPANPLMAMALALGTVPPGREEVLAWRRILVAGTDLTGQAAVSCVEVRR